MFRLRFSYSLTKPLYLTGFSYSLTKPLNEAENEAESLAECLRVSLRRIVTPPLHLLAVV